MSLHVIKQASPPGELPEAMAARKGPGVARVLGHVCQVEVVLGKGFPAQTTPEAGRSSKWIPIASCST